MRLEAVLLLAKTPLNPRKLSQLAHLADATEARTLVRQLNQNLRVFWPSHPSGTGGRWISDADATDTCTLVGSAGTFACQR